MVLLAQLIEMLTGMRCLPEYKKESECHVQRVKAPRETCLSGFLANLCDLGKVA